MLKCKRGLFSGQANDGQMLQECEQNSDHKSTYCIITQPFQMNCFAVAISVILLNTHSKSQLVSFQNNDDKNLVLQHKEIQEKKKIIVERARQ